MEGGDKHFLNVNLYHLLNYILGEYIMHPVVHWHEYRNKGVEFKNLKIFNYFLFLPQQS